MSEYSKALEETEKYLKHPIGFSNYESPKENSKVIIRQNNTILQLLVQILNKFDTEERSKDIVLASSGLVSSTKDINSDIWISLEDSVQEKKFYR